MRPSAAASSKISSTSMSSRDAGAASCSNRDRARRSSTRARILSACSSIISQCRRSSSLRFGFSVASSKKPWITVSGVLNSWETFPTKSRRKSSIRLDSVMSRVTTTVYFLPAEITRTSKTRPSGRSISWRAFQRSDWMCWINSGFVNTSVSFLPTSFSGSSERSRSAMRFIHWITKSFLRRTTPSGSALSVWRNRSSFSSNLVWFLSVIFPSFTSIVH